MTSAAASSARSNHPAGETAARESGPSHPIYGEFVFGVAPVMDHEADFVSCCAHCGCLPNDRWGHDDTCRFGCNDEEPTGA